MTDHCTRFDREVVAQGKAFRGRMEMVFAHAAVVRPEGPGRCLTLLHPDKGLVPGGVSVRVEDFRNLGGGSIRVESRRLFVSDGRGGGRTYRLQGPGVSLRVQDQWIALVPQTLKSQMNALEDRALGAPVDSFHRLARTRAESVAAVIARRLCGGRDGGFRYDEPVRGLAGLGPGLTPTGDDILCGMAAGAFHFSRGAWITRSACRAFAGAVRRCGPERTTMVSAEMLVHASAGVFPERLLELVTVLGTSSGSEERTRRIAERLCSTGGWSGRDMLAGVSMLVRAVLQRCLSGEKDERTRRCAAGRLS